MIALNAVLARECGWGIASWRPWRAWLSVAFAAFFFTPIAACAGTGNEIDRLDFGNLTSETVHNFEPGLAASAMPVAGAGAGGFTYRAPVGTGNANAAGSQAFTFTMSCDPARQTYLTIKLWGNDSPSQFIFNNAGYVDMQDTGPAIYPNRFYYYTMPIPESWTLGQTSVQVTLFFNALGGAVQGQPIYSAFTHTDPCFTPDSTDVIGTAPTLTGPPTYTALTAAHAVGTAASPGILYSNRSSLYTASTGYIDSVGARQVPSGTSGAPPEVIGLDLFSTVASWTAANPSATPDQWRNQIANTKAGPGYTAVPDELLGTLCTAYLTQPFVDSNGSTVTGLDRYHQSTYAAKIVAALDSITYEQDSDGGFIQQGSEWTGLTSTPRTTGAFIGSTARQATVHGGGDLQGVDTYSIGWTMVQLLNDPAMPASTGTATPTNFIDYLGGSFNANLDGTTMLRAYAYERMLFNAINFYTYGTGGTESQNTFQMLGLYSSYVALEKLQVIFPNTSYIPGPSTYNTGNYFGQALPTDGARMVLGIIPDTLRNIVYPTTGTSINYGMTTAGLGEADGAMSCGFDGGGYGQILPWLMPRLAQLSQWDPGATATDRSTFAVRANICHDAFDQFIYSAGNPTVSSGTVTSDTFSYVNETFITYRDPKNINSYTSGTEVNVQYPASDPNGAMQNPLALRAAYLSTQFNATPTTVAGADANGGPPSLNYSRDLGPYENTIRSLIGVSPTSLTPLPGEQGQPDYVWTDVQCGAVALVNHGEHLYMNANWRNTIPSTSNVARLHYTTGSIERGAQIQLPVDSTTVQADGNLSGTTYATPWVTRYGNYLFAFNHTTSSSTVTLPAGVGHAEDLVSKNFYNLGSAITVPAGQSSVLWLAASGTLTQGSGTPPTLVSAAAASASAVAGKTVNLSVLGEDVAGESNLTYTWSLTGTPPDQGSYSANGTNAAKNTTVTFAAAGTYNFLVEIADTSGLTTTSTVTVTVDQTPMSISLTPATSTLVGGQTQLFSATVEDQFGMIVASPPTLTWAVNGVGSVTTAGLYTASAAGSATVSVACGSLNAAASVTVLGAVGSFGGTLAIGAPVLTGSAAASSGTYTIASGGNDIWNTSDQFRYTFVPLTGNGTITARVVSMTDTSVWAKAGVMFRNTLDANSAYALAMVTPTTTEGNSFQYRASAGASAAINNDTPGTAPPYWVQISRSGNSFTAFTSPDGVKWTQLGTTLTLTMNQTAYVGLAVVSNNVSSTCTAVFDNVSITQPTHNIFPVDLDIGTSTGSYLESTSTVTMTAASDDIWGTSDSLHFAYMPIVGNGSITARVVSESDPASTAKAGVMMRNSINPASVDVHDSLFPNGTVNFEGRTAYAASGVAFGKASGITAPYWVRVVRSGNVFSAYSSPDGVTWTQVASSETVANAQPVMCFGLCASSTTIYAAVTDVFDNITVTGTVDTGPTIATDAAAGAVSGSTVNLSVLGADAAGESDLTYAWNLVGVVPGSVSFSANSSNAAKNTTATLSAGGTYSFQATVTNTAGQTVLSRVVSVTLAPSAPLNLAAAPSNALAVLTWTPSSGATSYNILRSTTSGSGFAQVGTSTIPTCTDSGAANGMTYYYEVTAANSAGTSAVSNQASVTPSGPVGLPTNFAATADSDAVTLSWTAAANATTYTIYRSVNGGAYTFLTTVTGTSYLDSGLTNGTTYAYVIFALNTAGTSLLTSAESASPASQSLYWDTTVVAGLGNGSGTWDVGITPTWSNSSAGTSNPLLAWFNDDSAYFETAGTMTATLATGTTVLAQSVNQAVNNTTTTISGGTIQIDTGAGITNGVGSGNKAFTLNSALVLNSGTVTIDNETTGGSIVLNGAISETGGIRVISKIGAGALQFGTSANTFTGGVIINVASTVNFYSPASFGTGTITVNAGTSLANPVNLYTSSTGTVSTLGNNIAIQPGCFAQYTGDHNMTFTGSLLGTGGSSTFSINTGVHSSAVAFSGDNHTFTGTIAYNDNGGTTLRLNTANSASAGAVWTMTGGATKGIAANVAGSNTFALGELTSASGVGLISNLISSGTATFQLGDSTTNSPSYGGIISNGTAGGEIGLLKIGTDAQTLSGANTYTGGTAIDGGTLVVNGSLAAGSSVLVNAGGTLAGTGTISGAATMSTGATLAPGSIGTGTLTFAAGLQFNLGSSIDFGLGAPTASSLVLLSGGTYSPPSGGLVTINVSALAGFGPGTYTLITGATGISASSFTLGTTPSGNGYAYQLSASNGVVSLAVITLPGIPTGLLATGTSSQVDLTWNAASGAASYTIGRSTTSGGPYTTIASGITTTSYNDTTVDTGTPYYYVVAGVNAAGIGTYSAEMTGESTTPSPATDTPVMPPWGIAVLAVLLVLVATLGRKPFATLR